MLIAEINYESLMGSGAITIIILWLAKTYLPRLIESHLAFVKQTSELAERQTVAIEILSGRDLAEHSKRTNAALIHGANAAESLVKGTEKEHLVIPHIDRMKRTLGEH